MASASSSVDVTMSSAPSIDEQRYSRQLYVMGHKAQSKMQASNILIVGLRGLGAEIAKNVILAGVRSVGLLDSNPVEIRDLSSQFYLSESNVGQARASACFPLLAGLNKYVNTHVVDEPLSEALLASGRYQCLVLIGATIPDQIKWNHVAHANGLKFIAGDVLGLMAACFVDVGDNHEVDDPDGERPLRGIVTSVTNSNPGVVTTQDEKRHGLSTGDLVTLEDVEGMVELNQGAPRVIKVSDPYTFSIEDTTNYRLYTGNGYWQQVKPSKIVKHVRLDEAVKNLSATVVYDLNEHHLPLHCLRAGLSRFQEKHNRLPNPTDFKEAQEVVAYTKEYSDALGDQKVNIDEKLATRLARCASASIVPMTAFLGGVLGQEVLKCVSGKFSPITQLYYFDAVDVLPDNDAELGGDEFAPLNSRYDDQIAVIGRTLQARVRSLQLFLVGAGAIGCEMLKNWALMGVATSSPGVIHITDMDTIEISNLSRQFLFRDDDVGKLKSVAAAAAVARMNSDLKISSHSLRVGPDSESVYDDRFWQSLDACCTALDNVDARLYVDSRAVYFQRPLIDSGTLGTKGNTQVVVPFLTEAYGSSRDPPEEDIPICTLKNFPHKIEHTIQWARDFFEGTFTKNAQDVNSYITDPDYLQSLAKSPNSQLQTLETIYEYLVTDRPQNFDACVVWGRLQFEVEFNHKIRQLAHSFPEDSLTASGAKFWSGSKRFPQAIVFNPEDPLHMGFVVAAANLRAFNFGLPGSTDLAHFNAVLNKTVVPSFEPKSIKIATDEKEAKAMAESKQDQDHDQKVASVIQKLPARSSLSGVKLHPVAFEKDDDTNFHMDFITACSNLRARNYRIKESNKHETKFIAGKIIPAIATTTALVTGLVCLELLKVIQKKPITAYRNTYVNLAIGLFAGSEPMPCATSKAVLKDKGEWNWSLWDRIDVDIGDCTMGQFIQHFEEKHGLAVSMLTYKNAMLYVTFGMNQAKMRERLAMPISRVVETVAKVQLGPNEKYLQMEACVTNADDEDVEIPVVRVKFRD